MILVVAEQKDGRLNRVSWEAIAAAQELAGGQTPISVAVLGASVQEAASELSAADVGRRARRHARCAGGLHAGCLRVGAGRPDRRAVAGPRRVSPTPIRPATSRATLAARLDRTLVTDVIGLSRGSDGTVHFARPMFQGKLVADVVAEGPAPHLVSFQIGAFRADAARRGSGAPVTAAPAVIDAGRLRQRAEAPFQEAKAAVDLSQAERIVAVGRGIKAQEHLAMAERLAAAFGAELAASRPICDNGWLPMDRQIGSSGQTVAPKLYVAVGISGAIQHLVGMKGARTIVAINKDPDAPMFEVADYGIEGDLFEIAPALIAELGRG